MHIQQECKDNLMFSSFSGISSDAIPLDCAKSYNGEKDVYGIGYGIDIAPLSILF